MTVQAPGYGLLAVLACCLLAATACAPALDWRDLRLANTALRLQLPCKPDLQRRDLLLAATQVSLSLHVCTAGGSTWAVGFAEIGDPGRVEAALSELSAAASAKLGPPVEPPALLQVPGATPHAASKRLRLQGRLPGGKNVRMEIAVFAFGTTVFQTTVLGEQVAEDAAEAFFSSMRFEQ